MELFKCFNINLAHIETIKVSYAYNRGCIGVLINGYKQGIFYYADRPNEQKIEYLDNKMHGILKIIRENGKICIVKKYINDVNYDVGFLWCPDGRVGAAIIYDYPNYKAKYHILWSNTLQVFK